MTSQPLVHPSWCDPDFCEATYGEYGKHRGKPLVVGAGNDSDARVQLRLAQPLQAPSPRLELTVGDHRTGQRLLVALTLGQGQQTRLLLGRLLDQARVPQPRNQRGYADPTSERPPADD